MRYFRSVVGGLVLAMFNARHHLFFRGGVASKFVRSHFNRGSFLAFQQLTKEAFGSALILAALYQDIQQVTVLIRAIALKTAGHFAKDLIMKAG